MKPCPRCASPFVQAQRLIDETQFRCFVCHLDFTVPQALEAAVVVWDAWKRSDPYASAETMTEMALLNLQRGATRLERLVCAIVQAGPMEVKGMDNGRLALTFVRFARDLEKGIEGGLVDLEELGAKIRGITPEGRNTLRTVLRELQGADVNATYRPGMCGE